MRQYGGVFVTGKAFCSRSERLKAESRINQVYGADEEELPCSFELMFYKTTVHWLCVTSYLCHTVPDNSLWLMFVAMCT